MQHVLHQRNHHLVNHSKWCDAPFWTVQQGTVPHTAKIPKTRLTTEIQQCALLVRKAMYKPVLGYPFLGVLPWLKTNRETFSGSHPRFRMSVLLEDMSLLGESTANKYSSKKQHKCMIKCIEHCINIHIYTYISKIPLKCKYQKKNIDIGFRFDTIVFKEKKSLSFSLHISRSSPVPGPGESLGFWPHLWWIQGLGNHQFVELACVGLLERMDPFCNKQKCCNGN